MEATAGATPAVKLVPIAYKVESYDPTEARVSIWAVWLIAEQGILAPQQNWITLQLSLHWLDQDWKMAASGAHPGPVPQPPQGAGVEPAFHLNPSSAGQKHCQLTTASSVPCCQRRNKRPAVSPVL